MSWSPQQLAALKAFKMPMYQSLETQPVAPAISHEPTATPEKAKPEEQVQPDVQQTYYQVGIWTLYFPNEVPVPRYQWLDDLSKAFDTRPTQINRPSESTVVIDCTAYAKPHLSQQEKQSLWAQLKPYLQS